MPVLVDQQAVNSGGPFSLIDGGTYSHLAQGYTPSKTFLVTQIELSLSKIGSPTGTIQLHIRQVSGGDPGTSITNGDSATLNASAISSTNGFVAFTFSTPPSVTISTLYYIELTHSGATFDVSNNIAWALSGGNSYAGGTFKFKINNGAWTEDTDPDMAFKTYEAASSASSSPSSSLSPSPSVSISASPSVTPSSSISLSPSSSQSPSSSISLSSSLSPSPSPVENSLCVDLVCVQFIINYTATYSVQNSSYSDKYSVKNTVYEDKYTTKTDDC
jgi:hypothetical protein